MNAADCSGCSVGVVKGCHKIVTSVSQECYMNGENGSGCTVRAQKGCYKSVSKVLQSLHLCATRVQQECC
jgi:hypothetical protein